MRLCASSSMSCWTGAVSRSFWAVARFTGSLSPRSCVTWRPSTRAVTRGTGSPTTALWVHAKRHYDLAGIAAYWRTRMSKEFKEFKKALRG